MVPSPRTCSVLVVDDEPSILALLSGQLRDEFVVYTASSAEQARHRLREAPVDIVVSDLQMSDGSGIQLLDWVQQHTPWTARVLLTGTARVEDAVEAINNSRIHRLILKPWRADDLLQMLRQVARGLLLERSHEELLEELRRLNLELEQRVQERTRELQSALSQLQHKNQILEKMALTDPLTSLPNRRAIELIARKELLRRTRVSSPLGFGLIDADRFKQINSTYLLSGGDHVLSWLAQVLQSATRAADSIGRVGGEEFMVVAPNTDREGAEALAERLRATVEQGRTVYRKQVIPVTVSVGFAVAGATTAVGYEQLREQAAVALAEAKAIGRNQCVVRLIV